MQIYVSQIPMWSLIEWLSEHVGQAQWDLAGHDH